MKIIGLTGGIGAGKSTVAEILQKEYKAYIITTDIVGHLIMKKGEPSYELIIKEFGQGILDESEEINRKELGKLVFQDEDKRKKLNDYTHPFIWNYIRGKIDILKEFHLCDFIVIEAALLHESRFYTICDETWNVTAPIELRIERLLESREISTSRIKSIMDKQSSEKEYDRLCDFTIINDTKVNTYEQIKKRILDMEVP